MRDCLRVFSCFLLACVLVVARADTARAAGSYHALDRSLTEVVADLSRMLHVPMSVTHADAIEVKDWQASGGERAIIRQLCANFALVYFFDGSAYHFIPAADVKSHVLFVGHARFGRAVSVIRALYPRASRDAIRLDPRSGMIVLRSPDTLAEDVKKALQDLPAQDTSHRLLIIRAGIRDDLPEPAAHRP